MWVRRLGSNSSFFALKRFLWILIYTVIERVPISTRLGVFLDWPHDIYTLRGSPVARDRGSAQWQVFCCGPWKRRIEIGICARVVLFCVRGIICGRCWHCHVDVFGFKLFKWPPSPPRGWNKARHFEQTLVSLLLPKHSPKLHANPLTGCPFPWFSGWIGSQSKLWGWGMGEKRGY